MLRKLLRFLARLLTLSNVGSLILILLRLSSAPLVMARMVPEVTPWWILMTLVLSIHMGLTMRWRVHVVEDVVMGLVVMPMVGMASRLMTILVKSLILWR